MTHHPEPESDLLLRCARLHLSDGGREELRARLQGPMDGARLLERAAHHRLVPLAHRHLSDAGLASLAPGVAAELARARGRVVRRSMAQLGALHRITAGLAAAGVPAMPVKGVALARELYGDAMLRESRDVDVLVPRHHVPAAVEVLRGLGFHPPPPLDRVDWRSRVGARLVQRDRELTLAGARPTDPVVELQWSLGLGPREGDAPWREAVRAEVDGVPVYGLSREWLLVYLCYHGSHHLFGRLHWLCDVGVAAAAGDGWEGAERLARRMGVASTLGAAAAAAHALLGAPLPPLSRATLRSGAWLRDRIAANLLRPDPVVLKGGVAWRRLLFRTHGGGLRGLRRSLDGVLAPSSDDFSAVGFSDRLAGLAYAARALRIAARWRG